MYMCIEEVMTCFKMDAKKIYITFLIYFLNNFIDNGVQIFVIKQNLFCQLPADVLILEESDFNTL